MLSARGQKQKSHPGGWPNVLVLWQVRVMNFVASFVAPALLPVMEEGPVMIQGKVFFRCSSVFLRVLCG